MKKTRKRKKRINPKLLITAFILAVTAAVLFLTPLFQINEITVEGQSRVTKAEIMVASGIRLNRNIFAINKNAAKNGIKALGFIEDVKIKRKLPHCVEIQVKEGSVSAYVEFEDVYAGVNKKGQTLCRVSKAAPPGGAPVVAGIGVKEAAVGKNIVLNEGRDDEYKVLLRLMETFEAYDMTENITFIDITRKNNIVFKYKDVLKVEFGDVNDYDLKFNYLSAMVGELGDNVSGVINMQSENYVYRNSLE